MADKKEILRQMASELDKVVDRPFGAAFHWPSFGNFALSGLAEWAPETDGFERGNRLVTKVDLPALKKEDVKVEVTDGRLPARVETKARNVPIEEAAAPAKSAAA